MGWTRISGLKCGLTLLCRESSGEGVCLCWSNGLPLRGCSSPSAPRGGICAQSPAYHPAHGHCEKGCWSFRKPKAVATNARVMPVACKSPCQKSQAEGTMLYFYFKILLTCMCARKRQKFAVIFNLTQLLVVKGGYKLHSPNPQDVQQVYKLRLWDWVGDAGRQWHCWRGEQGPLVGSEPTLPKAAAQISHPGGLSRAGVGCPSIQPGQPRTFRSNHSRWTLQSFSPFFACPRRYISFLHQPQTRSGVSTRALCWKSPQVAAYSILSFPKWNAALEGQHLTINQAVLACVWAPAD